MNSLEAKGVFGAEILSDLSLLLLGLELKYGELDGLLGRSELNEEKINRSEDLIRKLKRLMETVLQTVASVDRLLPRLLVGIGSVPTGSNARVLGTLRGELLRLFGQPGVCIEDWDRLVRNAPLPVKLALATTADRVARRFPFLLQEYRLQRQLSW